MTIGVYGTGRFGAFWATALSKYATVLTYNRSDRPVPRGTRAATLEELGTCDAVMLCVAISATSHAVDALRPHLVPGCLVMDTCSVKVYPTTVMSERLDPSSEIIGTHPMFGPDSAANGFTGLPIVFCPVRCAPTTADSWRRFFADMGLQVIDLTPDEHDREAAFTQGVTHFIGRLLADMHLVPSRIGTVGYRKLLEVVEQTCNDPYSLFEDLQRLNPHTSEMREQLQASLNRLITLLASSLDTGESRS